MTIDLNLSPEQQASLEQRANAKHQPVSEYVESLIQEAIGESSNSLVALLDSWASEDATEDVQELERRSADLDDLKAGLDASRLSSRKLFS
jgi:hypothetical protein